MMAREFLLLFSSLVPRLNFTVEGTNEKVLFKPAKQSINWLGEIFTKGFTKGCSGWWWGLLRAGVMSFGVGMTLGYIWGCWVL